jgi:hypothetical protein
LLAVVALPAHAWDGANAMADVNVGWRRRTASARRSTARRTQAATQDADTTYSFPTGASPTWWRVMFTDGLGPA